MLHFSMSVEMEQERFDRVMLGRRGSKKRKYQSDPKKNQAPPYHLYWGATGCSGRAVSAEPVSGHPHSRAACWEDPPERGEGWGDLMSEHTSVLFCTNMWKKTSS